MSNKKGYKIAGVLVSGNGMSDNEVCEFSLQIRDMIDQLQRFRDCIDEHESLYMNCDADLAHEAGLKLLELVKGLEARGF